MNKHYTPEIEEFHVGFEYEYEDIIESGASDYFKGIIEDPKEIGDLFYNLWENGMDIRVKYLDREDIESLGFTRDRIRAEQLDTQIYFKGQGTIYIIRYVHGGHVAEVTKRYKGDSEEDDIVLFYGKIKNKSELKKILEQVKISIK